MKDVPTLTASEIDDIRQLFENKGIQTNIDGLE